jgi:lipoate-protein ligase A
MMFSFAHCRLVEYACLDGRTNMEIDRRLLDLCEQMPDSVFLRFYSWTGPTLSLGHLESTDTVDRVAAERDGVTLVRRPTGGRMVLHGDDLTYTVVMPKPDAAGLQETYGFISEILVGGLATLGVRLEIERGRPGRSHAIQKPCFASVSRYEVTYHGRKVIGSAQRVGDRALLQHGSIPLGPGYLDVVRYMAIPEADRARLLAELEAHTSSLSDALGRRISPEEVAAALEAEFRTGLDCGFSGTAVEGPVFKGVPPRVVPAVNPRDKSP